MTRKKSTEKKTARALQRDTGITYTEALAIVRRSSGHTTADASTTHPSQASQGEERS